MIEKIIERIVERPLRRRLPDTRNAITHKFDVAGHEGYITVGLYEDGQPGEVFITMAKEGSTIGGLMDCHRHARQSSACSTASRSNPGPQVRTRPLRTQRHDPQPEIPMAKSLVDYIFRWLAMEFIPGYRAANAPQRHPRKSRADLADASA